MRALAIWVIFLLGCGSSSPASSDAGIDAGDPIVAPADQWTWVDFPDSRCGAGTPTGIAVNPHAGATTLAIYFEGGGSCSDAASCWGPTPKARNMSGYDSTTFAAAPQRNYALLNRSTSGNPFAAMNLVYVPYCTGDLHSGSTTVQMTLADGGAQPTYFYGDTDLGVFLQRLVPTFAGTTRVIAMGTSAGGFGTFLEFDRLAQAFQVPVDILDDSGPPLVFKGSSGNPQLIGTWGYKAPCTGCDTFREVLDYDLQLQQGFAPAGLYAFLSFTQDTTIAPDFGYTLAEYPSVMTSFSSSLPTSPAAATCLVAGEQAHVVQSDPTLAARYLPWVAKFVAHDPSWADACVNLDGGTSCP